MRLRLRQIIARLRFSGRAGARVSSNGVVPNNVWGRSEGAILDIGIRGLSKEAGRFRGRRWCLPI